MNMSWTWSFTTIGYLVWGITCLIGGVCMIALRSKPSNGICLEYLQYLCAHTIFVPIILINTSLSSDNQTAQQVLNMLQDMILAFAAGCYMRVGNIIWFKYQPPFHRLVQVIAWMSMLLVWFTIVILHFGVGLPQISQFVYASYYSLAALFAYAAIIREMWFAMHGHNSPAYTEGANVRSMFSGYSRLLFTFFGLFAGTWGMIDWILIILSAFHVPIWEASFLSRLFDSLFYVPFVVLYLAWWDCPVNVKMDCPLELPNNENSLVLSE